MQDMVRVKYDMVEKNGLTAQRRIGLYHHFLGVFEWKGYRYISSTSNLGDYRLGFISRSYITWTVRFHQHLS